VLYEGRVFSELVGDEINEENIVSAALGLNTTAGKQVQEFKL